MTHILWASLAIPVIIHLVYRRKSKTIPFSTLYFLRQIDQRIQRRHRLKQLLLLLVRLALLAALIAALAQPVLRFSAFHNTGMPINGTIILDNTGSMRTLNNGVTSFSKAKDAAQEVLNGLDRGDKARLAMINAPAPSPAPLTTDIGHLQSELQQLECSYGTGTINETLHRLAQTTQPPKDQHHEIYIITDMQGVSWSEEVLEKIRRLADNSSRITFYLVPAGGDVDHNLAVTDAHFGERINVPGRVAQLQCQIRNTGQKHSRRNLAFHIGTSKRQNMNIEVAAGGKRRHEFEHRPEEAGYLTGHLQLESDDLPADNIRYFVTRVRDEVPVLLIRSGSAQPAYQDGTHFLESALKAGTDVGGSSSPITIHTASPETMSQQSLSAFSVLIMVNVPQVDDALAGQLRDYLMQGGGLVIFPGNSMQPSSYNLALGSGKETFDADTALLPGTFGTVQRPPDGKDFFRVQRVNVQHPLFHNFIDDFDVRDIRISRLLALNLSGNESAPSILLSTDAGPLLVTYSIGDGTVVVSTTSCSTQWSDMALKPLFAPLLQRIVYHLGGTRNNTHSIDVDSGYNLQLPEGFQQGEVRIYPPQSRSDTPQNDPSQPISVTVENTDDARSLKFTQTDKPGIYRAEFAPPDGFQDKFFAVNVPSIESNLARLATDEVKTYFGDAPVVIVDNPDHIKEAVTRHREGLPLWNYLLLLAIILAVVETFIANVWLAQSG